MKFLRMERSDDGLEAKLIYALGPFEIQATCVCQPRRVIICIPTQIGCIAGCTFCASGVNEKGRPRNGFKRHLSQTEILELCHDIMTRLDVAKWKLPVVVCTMGEGEPLTNQQTFEAWTRSFQALEAEGLPFLLRFVGSTSGFSTGLIKELADVRFRSPFKLQVSLHSARQEVRRKMVPHSRPVTEIIEATRVYRVRTNNGRVDMNCVCCKGADTEADARMLGQMLELIKGPGLRVKVNEHNPVVGSHWEASSPESVETFGQIIAAYGLEVLAYHTGGKKVSGACGQLSSTIAVN